MKIVEEYPPNYNEIFQVFPNLEEHRPIFAYGDTIYNPFKVKVTPDLEVHESTHTKQQGNSPEIWWTKYLFDKHFRLEQEIEAYGEQLRFIQGKVGGKLYDWVKQKMAEALSGELYGNLLTYGEAESKIRNYAKNSV